MSTWETASVCSTDWGLHRLLFWPSFCNCEMWSMFPLSCYPCTVLTGCYPALFLDIFLLINNPYLSPLNALQQTTYTHCMCLGSFGESLLCKDSPQNLNNILKHIHTVHHFQGNGVLCSVVWYFQFYQVWRQWKNCNANSSPPKIEMKILYMGINVRDPFDSKHHQNQ